MKSNVEWSRWGNRDPLYAVATWAGKHKAGPAPWTDDEFYSQGASDWADFLGRWSRYGICRRHCVEIGCGAGRITKHLARDFDRVTAVDVSPDMLQYASRHIDAKTVSFVLSNGNDLPLAANSASAVISTHVFQHFDSGRDISAVFREVYRVLMGGGTMMVHLPIHYWPVAPRLLSLVYAGNQWVARIRASFKRRLLQLGIWTPLMRFQSTEAGYLFNYLREIGFADVEILVFSVTSNNHPHPFVFGRKKHE